MDRVKYNFSHWYFIVIIALFHISCGNSTDIDPNVSTEADAGDVSDVRENIFDIKDDAEEILPELAITIVDPEDEVFVDLGTSLFVEYELDCEPAGCHESLRCRVRNDSSGIWSNWQECSSNFAVTDEDVDEGHHTIQVQLLNTEGDQVEVEARHTALVLFSFDAYIEGLDVNSPLDFTHPYLGEFNSECTHPNCEITTCEWADDLGPTLDCNLDDPFLLHAPTGVATAELLLEACSAADFGDGIEHCIQKSYEFSYLEPNWRDVSPSGNHTCGILDDDSMWCWGNALNSVLGVEEDDGFDYPTKPVPGQWKEVVAGMSHNCAINIDDQLYCWGNNINRNVIPTSSDDWIEEPTPIDDQLWDTVATGMHHTCAITKDQQSLYCWGKSEPYLSDGEENSIGLREVPMPSEANAWLLVVAGEDHSCAAVDTDDGQLVYCWGDQTYGMLGNGIIAPDEGQPTPVQVDIPGDSSDPNVIISLGASFGSHTCITVDPESTIPQSYCWGLNDSRQLGGGEYQDDNAYGTPQMIPIPGPLYISAQFNPISAGFQHTCGVGLNQRAYCWGSSNSRRLGTTAHDFEDAYAPLSVDFSEFSNSDGDVLIESIFPGHSHSCAISVDHELYCWGANYAGKVGNEDGSHATTPQPVHWQFAP